MNPRVTLPPFPPDHRASGILLHVSSLPSPYGIGDVGPAVLTWLDRLREAYRLGSLKAHYGNIRNLHLRKLFAECPKVN
jgi:hypothetical protein